MCEEKQLLYSFFNADQIIDFRLVESHRMQIVWGLLRADSV